MRPLTILFDSDDTAENLLNCWVGMLNERYGTTVTIDDVKQWNVALAFPELTEEQVYGVLQMDALWERLAPLPGSQRVLQRLHDEGHKLYMVTASDYRTCRTKFDRILALFPFLDANHIIITSNKQMVKGDILIDDGPHNLVGGDYFKILFDRPHNRTFDATAEGAVRAFSWDDVYEMIYQYIEREDCYGCN